MERLVQIGGTGRKGRERREKHFQAVKRDHFSFWALQKLWSTQKEFTKTVAYKK
jgi:hypothetical protein